MAIGVVEHEPAGAGIAMLALAAGHLLADDVIGGRLVEIAFALLVDHHAAGQRPLDRAQPPAILARHVEYRRGPGRLQVHRLRAQRLSGADRIAGVAPGPTRIERIGIKRSMGIAHGLVLVEPARCQHHALARADPHDLAIAADHSAGDLALFVNQFLQPAIEPQRHLRLVQRQPQSARQGIAQGQAAILARGEAERPVKPVPHQALRQVQPPALGPEQQDIGLVEVPVEIAEQRGRRRGEAQGPHVPAQPPPVQRQRHVGAIAGGRAAGVLGMVIGIGKGVIFDLGIGAHPAQHLGRVGHIGADVLVRHVVGRQRADIFEGILDIVVKTSRRRLVAGRNPDPRARGGRGATPQLLLLDDQHIGMVLRRDER